MGWTPGARILGSLLPLKFLSHQAGLTARKWAGEGLQIGGPLPVQGGPFFPSCSCTLAQAWDTWCPQGGLAAPTLSATEIGALGFSTGGSERVSQRLSQSSQGPPIHFPNPTSLPLYPRQETEVSNRWENDGGLATS